MRVSRLITKDRIADVIADVINNGNDLEDLDPDQLVVVLTDEIYSLLTDIDTEDLGVLRDEDDEE